MSQFSLSGYVPGAVGKITELHAVYYHDHWGFDVSFETQVGAELSDFVRGLCETRDGLWLAWHQNGFAGSIAVDGRPFEPGAARLRWFIVDPPFHGMGIGKHLLECAIGFCRERPYRRLYLWTFRGLDTAFRLYRNAGFTLTQEHSVRQWGQTIHEQRLDLILENAPL